MSTEEGEHGAPALSADLARALKARGVPAELGRIQLALVALITSAETDPLVLAIAVGVHHRLSDELSKHYRHRGPGEAEMEELSAAMEYFEQTGQLPPGFGAVRADETDRGEG